MMRKLSASAFLACASVSGGRHQVGCYSAPGLDMLEVFMGGLACPGLLTIVGPSWSLSSLRLTEKDGAAARYGCAWIACIARRLLVRRANAGLSLFPSCNGAFDEQRPSSRSVIHVERRHDLPSDLRICAEEEDSILFRRLGQEMVDGDQCGSRVPDEHLVALREPNMRKLGCERLLGCVDFGTVIAVNSPGKTHSASGIDTFVLEPGFPDELR